MGLPALPGLECFLSHVRKLFTIIYLSISQALPLFSFWDPYNGNVGAFNFVSEVSETVLVSFLSFFFVVFWAVISTTLSAAHFLIFLPRLFCH